MTLDDIKGRTYTSTADFWRDIESVVAAAETARNDAREWAAHLNARAQANLERANAAEAHNADLQRHITALQERGTALVLERRAARTAARKEMAARLREMTGDSYHRRSIYDWLALIKELESDDDSR